MTGIRNLTLVLLFSVLTAAVLSCQTKSNSPLPEFYGTYAISNGKLISVDSGSPQKIAIAAAKVGHHGDTYKICDNGAPVVPSPARVINIADFAGNVEFVVFFQTSGEASAMRVAQSLEVGELGFVRNTNVNCGTGIKTGAEGGWETVTRHIELRVKPVPGQQEMVIAVPSAPLEPGVYVLSGIHSSQSMFNQEYWFAVSPLAEAEKTKCIDVTVQFNRYQFMNGGVLGQTFKPCGADAGTGAPSVTNSMAACADFDSCMRQGRDAFRASDWATAIANFQTASQKSPSRGEPWVWIGNTYLATGRTDDLPSPWDKALALGSPLSMSVCHERSFRPCELGSLTLDAKSVAFTTNGGQVVFSAPPSDMHPGGRVTETHAVRFTVRDGRKNYGFNFVPFGVECETQLFVACPDAGFAQQSAVADYVLGSFSKLGSASPSSGTAQTGPSVAPAKPAAPQPPNCKQAVDLGYSILLRGHLYKVQSIGTVVSDHRRAFHDESGQQATDPALLQQLAVAAWTRENVVTSQDARNGAARVGAILSTSKALEGYSTVQDAFARGMVEALEATVTDGASLATLVPHLTTGIVVNQLKSAPRTAFVLTAQRGMEASVAAYREMQAVPIPPVDATVVNAPDLSKIRPLYLKGRTLELPYDALAAKLMPTTAAQLTNQALSSAISEAVPSLGAGGATQVSLESLLDFQKALTNLSSTLPALKAYSQNLNLALSLNTADARIISDWSEPQPPVCGARSAVASR